ncbi:MAG TPA: glycosyltransferase family 1 protein [Opitutaceae bacterium]|nr:glycosyltransferase family 1 protein [Opitutaceae bacterium]
MKLFIDGYVFAHSPHGGIARYTRELVGHFSTAIDPVVLTLASRDGESGIEHPALKEVRVARFGFRPGRLAYAVEPWRCRWARWRTSADIIHPSYYETLERQPVRGSGAIVVTCHDMAHEKFPGELDRDGYWRAMKRRSLERADCILCVSQTTRDDLVAYYPALSARSRVVHLGSDSLPSNENESAPHHPWAFVYVGGRRGYKRFALAAEAIALAAKKMPVALRFHIVGNPLSPEERQRLHELGLSECLEVHENPSDPLLAALYRECGALLYPSCWEGFGFPPLEAARAGCIPLYSRANAAVVETLQGTGVCVTEDTPEAWADACIETSRRIERRDSSLAQAQTRAVTFRWEKTARATEAIYREVSG